MSFISNWENSEECLIYSKKIGDCVTGELFFDLGVRVENLPIFDIISLLYKVAICKDKDNDRDVIYRELSHFYHTSIEGIFDLKGKTNVRTEIIVDGRFYDEFKTNVRWYAECQNCSGKNMWEDISNIFDSEKCFSGTVAIVKFYVIALIKAMKHQQKISAGEIKLTDET